jgi:hypothetical protein
MTHTVPHSRIPHGPLGLPVAHAQALARLERDPLWQRVPAAHRAPLADLALAHGAHMCEYAVQACGTRDAVVMARILNVPVAEQIAAHGPFAVLSAYNHKPPQIVLFRNVIQTCREQLLRTGTPGAHRLKDICTAHELFHHLERGSGRLSRLQYRVTVLDAGVFKIRKSLHALSEVAAHAFAASLLGLGFLPCELDAQAFAAVQRAAQQHAL